VGWPEIVIAIIAVHGAVLSTYNFAANRLEKRRVLSISFKKGFLSRSYKKKFLTRTDSSPLMLFVTVANPSNRTITVDIPRIKVADASLVLPVPQSNIRFPHELREGQNCMVWIEMKELADFLIQNHYQGRVKLLVEVEDDLGKMHRSKAYWRFDVNEWVQISQL